MDMLKPTIKESGTTTRERYLAKLSEDTFFGLWSFPNVYTNEGITKSSVGNELCDLLVVFQNKILIFSDKDIAFDSGIDLDVSWKRWFKRSVIKSSNQLYGAEKWLQSYPERVFLDKACTNIFPIHLPEKEYDIHLIAVTCNTAGPAEKYYGGGSSGTLYQLYSLDYKDCLDQPFNVGDLFPDKTYVHVLDEITLDLLIKELSTISDFVAYLEEKERAIRTGEIIQAAGEEDLLAHYFRGRSKSNKLGRMIHPTGNLDKDGPISLFEGLWSEYVREEEYRFYSKLTNSSIQWDQLIDRFSFHILEGTVGSGQDLEFKYHERAVRHLASENRFSRYLLSKAFEEKISEVPPNRRSSRLVFSPERKDKLYIFLFFPRDKNEDYQEYRDKRLACIKAYVLVAKYQHPTTKDIIVIATEPMMANRRSEDIFSIEFDEALSEEENVLARQLMFEEQILNDVWTQRTTPLTPQQNKPHRNKLAKSGRNDRCPCGSDRKYKKCCL